MKIECRGFLDNKLPPLRASYTPLKSGLGYFFITFRGERYTYDAQHRGGASGAGVETAARFQVEWVASDETVGEIDLVAETEAEQAFLSDCLVFRKRAKETIMFVVVPRQMFLDDVDTGYAEAIIRLENGASNGNQ